jgi:molybdenum-dependent DNA-binding transcriptional regulator ModE
MSRTIPPDWHLRTRLKVRQLALLVAIAEHRSLRRAAQAIAVTQPAATRMLGELEDALGFPVRPRRVGHAADCLWRHPDPLCAAC